jgi:hypothetical protein
MENSVTRQKDQTKIRKTTNAGVLDLSEQRQLAKAGMVGSIGALFATGFLRFKGARMLHPWLGWALLGFSVWHHVVSKPQSK